MKRHLPLLRFFLLLLLALGWMVPHAQRGESLNLSDEQLMQFLKQGQNAGLSETEIMNLLVQRGMSAADVNSIKKRIGQLQGNPRIKSANGIRSADTVQFARDSAWVKETPAPKKPTPFFGFDFFNRKGVSFEPAFNTSTPGNYVLGPGDELNIDVTGMNERSISRTVDRDGRVEIPHGGFVSVNGLSVDAARQRIRNRLASVYPALNSGRTQLNISLGNVRSIGITIIGESLNPGNYRVSGLSSVFNILYLSGGPSQYGSLRNIELIRGNKVIAVIDFYNFLSQGILAENIRLEDQDVIRFPVYTKRVVLAGAVKKPAVYELREKETLADLLRIAGGTSDSAQQAVAKIAQRTADDRRFRDVEAPDFDSYIPRNADSIYFEQQVVRFTNRIHLNGAVNRPGDYELTDNLSLKTLLQKANGLREDAFTGRAYIMRRNGAESNRTFIAFNPAEVVAGANDVLLQKDDSVVVASRDNLNTSQVITITGSVRQPRTITYYPGITVEDAILMAGGFLPDAALHRVEVSRLVRNEADTLANQLMQVLTLQVDSSLQTKTNPRANNILKPLDHIFIPRLLNYHSLGSVSLRGEVLYPGDYVLERRDETVQQVLARAGGITPLASLNNVQVYRGGLRVGTNLFQEGNQMFLLQPDDSIFIPRNTPFVEVKGQVFNPQIVGYQGRRFMSYISAAGGVTDNGNLKKAYVQYSNGINRKTRSFLFFRNYPAVRPGSSIIVPEAAPGGRRGVSFLEVSAVTGMLTALISLISVLRN